MIPEIFKILCAFLLGPTFARHLGEFSCVFFKTQDAGLPPVSPSGTQKGDYRTFEEEDPPADPTPQPSNEIRTPSPPAPDTPPTVDFDSQGSSEDLPQEFGPLFIPPDAAESLIKQFHLSRWVVSSGRRFQLEEYGPWLQKGREDPIEAPALERWADGVRIGVVLKSFAQPSEYESAKRSLWVSTLLYWRLGAEEKFKEGLKDLLTLAELNHDPAASTLVVGVRKILEGDVKSGQMLLKTIEGQSLFAAEILLSLNREDQRTRGLEALSIFEVYLAESYFKKLDAAGSVWGKFSDGTAHYRLQDERNRLLGGVLGLTRELLMSGRVHGLKEAFQMLSGERPTDALLDLPLLKSRIEQISPSTRGLLLEVLKDPHSQEILKVFALSQDRLRGQASLALADAFLEERGFPATAGAFYQLMSAGGNRDVSLSAEGRLKTLRGQGTRWEKVDLFTRGFLEGATSPSGVAAMLAAGTAFRLGKLAFLGNDLNRGRMFLGTVVGTTLEVPAFVFSHRAAASVFSSDPRLWDPGEIAMDLKRSGLMFSLAKVAGGAGQSVVNDLKHDFLKTRSGRIYLSTVHEPLQWAAFVGAHRIGRELGWSPPSANGWGDDLLEGSISYVQARGTASLAHLVAAPYAQAMGYYDFLRRLERNPPLIEQSRVETDKDAKPLTPLIGEGQSSEGRQKEESPFDAFDTEDPSVTILGRRKMGPATPSSGEIAILSPEGMDDLSKTRWEPKFELILVSLELSISRAFFARSGGQQMRLRFRIDPENQKPIGGGERVPREIPVSVLVDPAGRIISFDPSELRGMDLINAVFRSLEGKTLRRPEEPLVVAETPPLTTRADLSITKTSYLHEYLKANQGFLIDHLNRVARGEHQGPRLMEGETVETVFLFPDAAGRFEGIQIFSSQGTLIYENLPSTVLSPQSFVRLTLNSLGRMSAFDHQGLNESGTVAALELQPFLETFIKLDQGNLSYYFGLYEQFMRGIYPGEPQKVEAGEFFTKALIIMDPEGKFVGLNFLSNVSHPKTRINKIYKAMPDHITNLNDPLSPFKVIWIQLYPEGIPIKIITVPSMSFVQISALNAWFELAKKK